MASHLLLKALLIELVPDLLTTPSENVANPM